ncbi:MAG: Transcription antitermination protein nusG, partial [Parcubacteria group bacterium GW2011_GWA2_46_7]
RWYVIHTYSGYEDAVSKNLQKRIDSFAMHDRVFQVLVPKEKKVKVRGGKRITVEEKLFPGYVFVEMVITDESWYVVRNTPQVTGFIGAGITPIPVDPAQMGVIMEKVTADVPRFQLDVVVGDLVRITDGPFRDSEGKLSAIDEERGKVKVLVAIFGRETPVELDFLQIKKL